MTTTTAITEARTQCGSLLRAAKSAQTAWVKATIYSTPGNAQAMLALYRTRVAEYNVAVAQLHALEATAKREAFEASLSDEVKAARAERMAAHRAASAERMAAEREARRAERQERRGR